MIRFSSLRVRLAAAVLLAITPAWVVVYMLARRTGSENELPLTLFAVGMGFMALAAAWFGGERFILRQVRILSEAARQLAAGNLGSRAGLTKEKGELGKLAETFDKMAESLEQR